MLVHWIWLSARTKLNDREKAALLERFRDPEDIYFAQSEALAQTGLSGEKLENLLDKDLKASEEILRQCIEKHIHILTFQDAAYPGRLKNIADPPVVLYYKGRLPDMDGLPLIGVVGTRSATPYGITAAKRMGYQLARCGGVVVSGVASGIDSAAMQGCLSAGGTVIGVLGCGADVVYPRSSRGLYLDTERHGCLITEFPPGTEPLKWNFPKRNRIISGLSCGVLVVEAPEKSGALITARQAADQGRDVFVVPGNIDMPSCAGSNALLRDGAILCSSGWDVMSEYEALFPGKIFRDTRPVRLSASMEEAELPKPEEELPRVAQKPRLPRKNRGTAAEKENNPIDNMAQPPYSELDKDKKPSLSEREAALLDLIGGEECLVDDVIARSAMAPGVVLAALTMLEVKGFVTRLPGRRLRRNG